MQKLLKERKLECSGVYCYDEKFTGNKNQKYARLTLIDANTRVIINDLKIPKEDFTSDFVKNFYSIFAKRLIRLQRPHKTQSPTSTLIA